MNKLKKYIQEKGEYLNEGSDRQAYLLNGKVYKIRTSNINGNQTLKEYHQIQEIKKNCGNLNFIPSYELINNSICIMEYVDLIAEDCDDFSDWCYDNELDTDIYSFYDYCEKTFSDFKHHHFIEEIKGIWINDVMDNLGNFGYANGYIKIVDFGL